MMFCGGNGLIVAVATGPGLFIMQVRFGAWYEVRTGGGVRGRACASGADEPHGGGVDVLDSGLGMLNI